MIEKPLWISHRGYTKHAAENTRAAFQAAVQRGFSCLETDLRLTRDGRIVLIHDPDLARLAGDRRRVKDLSAAELACIRLKPPVEHCRSPGLPACPAHPEEDAARVMFFDAFAAAFPQCRWVLDIKPEAGDETILALARWAKTEGMVDRIIRNAKVLTWDAGHEALARLHFPGIQFYARRPECWRAGIAAMAGMPHFGGIQAGKTYAIPPSVLGLPLYRVPIVRRFHERGASVVAFLPPAGAPARRAVAAGFDEILTNHEKEAGEGPELRAI